MLAGSIIDAPEIAVRYVTGDRSLPIPEQAHAAFEQLEAGLNSLRGRKFYGVVESGEYRACVAIQPGASGESEHGLPVYRVPGGRYFCRRLTGFLVDPAQIGQVVDSLMRRSDIDSSRPVIEFYRGHDEVSIRVPVR